ncbi:hypothetical protein AVEN_121980-1, partial [Araneus ventricosus]
SNKDYLSFIVSVSDDSSSVEAVNSSSLNWISSVILTFRSEATRGLFWDRPRKYEPRTTPELTNPLQTFAPLRRWDGWPPTDDLTCHRPTYAADLWWNRVLNLKPSDLTTRPPQPRHDSEDKTRILRMRCRNSCRLSYTENL